MRKLDAFEIVFAIVIFAIVALIGMVIYVGITAPKSGIIYDKVEIAPHYETRVNSTVIPNGSGGFSAMATSSKSLKKREWILFIKDEETERTNEIKVDKVIYNGYNIGDYYNCNDQ